MKKQLIITLTVLILAFTLAGAVSATADPNVKYVSPTGSDDNDGSELYPYLTIGKGITSVNPNGTVNVANGTYYEHLIINKNLNLVGQSQENTIIDGSNTGRPLTINTGANVSISLFTICNGLTNHGGAIINHGYLTVTNSTIVNNTAQYDGGGISNYGTLTVIDSTISGNTASDGGGGILNSNTLMVSDSTISGNTAPYGGGIFNYGTLMISGSTISGNTGNVYGGGIYNGVTLTVSDSTISGNSAQYGGGIYNGGGTVTVSDSTISGNSAQNDAGGISNYGTLTVFDSTISGNTAPFGGGISNYVTLMVSGSTISGNTVSGHGGGIYNYGTVNVTGSTISSNSADTGAGIYNYGTVNVTGSTISGNTATNIAGGIYNGGGTVTVSGSTISGNTAQYGGGIYSSGTLTVNFNRIVGNSPTAIYNDYGSVDAEYNWWGSNNPDFTALISGVADCNPWLYMTLQADPTTILQGENSTLTASFNNAFDGTTVTPLNPADGHIPDKTPVTFNTDLGSVGSKTINKETINGVATATLTADEAAGIAHVNAVTDSQTVNTNVTIDPKSAQSSLYLTITPSKTNPMVGDTVVYTLKVGNKGPDTAENVVMTYVVPEGLEFAGANVDNGTYTYDPTTRTITWNIGDVPIGDPYMWLSLKVLTSGSYIINPTLSTSTNDPTLNTDTQSLAFNAAAIPGNNTNNNTQVKAVSMQHTGIPLIALIMALFMVLGGLVSSKK